MPLHYQPVGFQEAAAPPGGTLLGWNFRETTPGDDGPIDVRASDGQQDPHLYPRVYTNGNGISLTAGWSPAGGALPNQIRDNADQSEPRIAGYAMYSINTANRSNWDISLPNGTYRFWMGLGTESNSTVSRCYWFDGLTGEASRDQIFYAGSISVPANSFATANGDIKARATWLADYDTDYNELTLANGTGLSIEFRGSGSTGYFRLAHLRVEEQ